MIKKKKKWRYLKIGGIIGLLLSLVCFIVIVVIPLSKIPTPSPLSLMFYSLLNNFNIFIPFIYLIISCIIISWIFGLIIDSNLKKKKLVLLGGITLIITLIVVFSYFKIKPIKLYQCTKDPIIQDLCIKDLAKSSGNVWMCNLPFEEYSRSTCLIETITQKAKETGNIGVCRPLEKQDTYYEFADCINNIAEAQMDESLCESLKADWGTVQEQCYNRVIIAKADINSCYKTRYVAECYKEILGNSSNPELLCKNLKQGGSIIQCTQAIDCKKSKNSYECSAFIRQVSNDFELCKLEEDPRWPYKVSECYVEYGIRLQNIELCRMAGGNSMSSCITQIAITKDDPSICTVGIMPIRDCYERFAVVRKDPSFCYNIKEPIEQYDCIYEIAINSKDNQYCNFVKREDLKNECFGNMEHILGRK